MFRFVLWPLQLLKAFALFLLNGVILASGILTITAFWGEQNPAFDLTSHFRLEYLLIQLVGCGVILLMRPAFWRPWLALVTVFAALNIWQVLPFYVPSLERNAAVSQRFTLLQMNVWEQNDTCTEAARYMGEVKADVVAVEEISPACYELIQSTGPSLLAQYPHRLYYPARALALYSKRPVREKPAPTLSNFAFAAEVAFSGHPLQVLVVHPTRPYFPEHVPQVTQLRQFLKGWKGPRLMTGDFNASPWSLTYRQLQEDGDLRDSALGFGKAPTYPMYWPLPIKVPALPLIPIDHVMVGPELVVLSHQVGPNIGSDHLPVLVELGFRQ